MSVDVIIMHHTFNGSGSCKSNVHLNKDAAIISIKNAASKQWRPLDLAANKLIINVVFCYI